MGVMDRIDATVSKGGRVEVRRDGRVVMSGRPRSMQEFSDRLKAVGLQVRPRDTSKDDRELVIEEIRDEIPNPAV